MLGEGSFALEGSETATYLENLNLTSDTKWVQDFKGSNLLLFTADWCVRWAEQKNPGLELREFNNNSD